MSLDGPLQAAECDSGLSLTVSLNSDSGLYSTGLFILVVLSVISISDQSHEADR